MKRTLRILVVCMLVVSLFAACTKKPATSNVEGGLTREELLEATPAENKLPFAKEGEELTVMTTFQFSHNGKMLDFNDIECFKELEKRTGVHINFQTIPLEKLTLTLASNDLPDIILSSWDGVYQYAQQGQIVALDSLIAENMPNFLNIVKEDETLYDDLKDADGHIYCIPELRLDKELRVYTGWMIREDWLNKLNLKTPKSIDEMHDVLKAFKESDPNGNGQKDEKPMINGVDSALWWWGIKDYYRDGDTIKSGYLQPQYKEYLETMAKWYDEGLIDPEYISLSSEMIVQRMAGDKTGIFFGNATSGLKKYEDLAKKDYPDYRLAGVEWLSANGTGGYSFVDSYIGRTVSSAGMVITSKCKNPALAAKWIDYAFGKEGGLLFNFGIEGKSYTMENGVPTYTKEAFDSEKGQNNIVKYAVPTQYAFVQSLDYFKQVMGKHEQAAIDIWGKGNTDRMIPPLRYVDEELEAMNQLKNEIKTYADEMTAKFIVGHEPIENYDKFINQLKTMGVENVVEVMQGAYDRRLEK